MERDPRERLVDEVMTLGDVCAQILVHMHRSAGRSGSPEAVGEAFRAVVAGTLGDLGRDRPSSEIAAAADLLAETTTTIESEIVLVPVSAPPPGRRRRAARRR